MTRKVFAICALSVLTILAVLTSCESLEDAFGSTADKAVSDSISKTATTSGSSGGESGILDFKDGELLAAFEGSDWDKANYLVATTLTPASEQTKDEGEFLYVYRGESKWTPWFYESYIPAGDELSVGQWVFYCGNGLAHYSPMDRDSYREAWWYVGRITELDELYKGVVKIKGQAFRLEAVRLPAEPFKE